MKKYKILLFDLDDTLIDDRENIKHAIKKLLVEYKKDSCEKELERWIEVDKAFWILRQEKEASSKIDDMDDYSKQELAEYLRSQRFLIYFNNDISNEIALEMSNKYLEYLKENIVPVPGAYEVLKKLSENYKIYIITNGPSFAAASKIEKINCLEFVQEIYSADMFGIMKPSIKFINGVQGLLNNFNNEDYLIIGDSLRSDIGLGMTSNINTCWLNKNNEKLPEEYKPTIVINKLVEVIEKL
jgi:2-haloacid dehalogenase